MVCKRKEHGGLGKVFHSGDGGNFETEKASQERRIERGQDCEEAKKKVSRYREVGEMASKEAVAGDEKDQMRDLRERGS